MTAASTSPKSHSRFGPYSRRLRRGAIRDSVDGRSTVGRFIRDLEKQLTDHVGGSPTVVQQLLIDRLIRTTVQIDQLDQKLLTGTWTDLDVRTHGGLVNRQRLLARELGLKGVAERPPSLSDIAAEIAKGRAT